jgi:hypothetical protein
VPALLDLCAGLGGWSIGFHRAGFECTGVDVLDIGYPYRLIDADVCSWSPSGCFDVVTASPPCTEFSSLVRLAVARGQRGPADPEKGLAIVRGCIRIIEEVKPRFWILENVRGSLPFIEPLLGAPRLKRGPWMLWGKFPDFLLPESPEVMAKTSGCIRSVRYSKDHCNGAQDKLNSVFAFNPLRSFFRAKIPLPLSVPLGEACRDALALEVVSS